MGQTVRVEGEKNKGAEMKLVTFMKEGQKEREGMLGALLEGMPFSRCSRPQRFISMK